MTQYTTQMDAARHGIITPQMEIVAEKEHFDVEELRELIAKGQVIIPCNKNHKCISPSGVGAKLTTKINVNLGVSRDWKDVDMEYEKVHSAVEMGAEAIMDLSSYGDTRSFRRKLTSECPAIPRQSPRIWSAISRIILGCLSITNLVSMFLQPKACRTARHGTPLSPTSSLIDFQQPQGWLRA